MYGKADQGGARRQSGQGGRPAEGGRSYVEASRRAKLCGGRGRERNGKDRVGGRTVRRRLGWCWEEGRKRRKMERMMST